MRPPTCASCFALATVFVGAVLAHAQILTPAGPQIQVNADTAAFQAHPAVAALPGGEFVVVWGSSGSGGDDPVGVRAQRVDGAGDPVGPELQVASFTIRPPFGYRPPVPSLAAAPNGRYLVVWTDRPSQALWSIRGRLFARAGLPIGGEFQVSEHPRQYQDGPSAAAFADGGFVVAWNAGFYAALKARALDADANPTGNEIPIYPYNVESVPLEADVAVAGPGSFVVAWNDYFRPGSARLVAKAFSRTGVPLTSNVTIDDGGIDDVGGPDVGAAPSGDIAFAWGHDRVGGEREAELRILAPDGTWSGITLLAPGAPPGIPVLPALAGTADGSFAATWTFEPSSGRDDRDDSSIRARRFDSLAQPTGAEFLVNAYTTSEQRDSGIARATSDDDAFLLVWQSRGSVGDDASGDSIQARPLRITRGPYRASIAATMTAPGGPHEPGETVTYRLTMRNAGDPQPDQNGDELVSVLPLGLAPIAVRPDTGTATIDPDARTVRWNGVVVSGVEVVLEIDALIADDAPDGVALHQAELRFDADGDGMNEATVVTDDPGLPGASDPTLLLVARGLVFADGFESGGGFRWPGAWEGP